jgi:poly-beta-1,6-N-acetyl-D-glucosamine synthase
VLLFIMIALLIIALIIGVPLSYPFLLRFLIKRKTSPERGLNNSTSGSKYCPDISVIIPVYNEESVIENRINNIYQTSYSKDKIELIVVDSGSTDNTSEIVKNRFGNTITLIQEEERRGKAHAINLALKKCRGEIVIITDGPTLYEANSISEMVRAFHDPTVGGATLRYFFPNSEENLSEQLFWKYKDKIRILESQLQSTSYLSGEACAFRRSIIDNVAEDTLADDANIAFQILTKGYRTVVSDKSYFIEKPPSISEYNRIKARRALGGLQEILRHRRLFFNRNYGKLGTVILPYRFFMELVAPILFVILLGLIVPFFVELVNYVGILGAALLGGILLLALVAFRKQALTFFRTQLILLRGLILLLANKKDVRWTQSRTTRQN